MKKYTAVYTGLDNLHGFDINNRYKVFISFEQGKIKVRKVGSKKEITYDDFMFFLMHWDAITEIK